MTIQSQTFEFKSEARQLLDLMIHSIYSSKDVFLRELISNASDALDKRRFEALTSPEVLGTDDELVIRIETDADARTLTITDNGIGMSRDEVIKNLGTIARSGTKEFAAALREAQTAEGTDVDALIGQFGVGFYSAFIAADRVVVTTRRADAPDGASAVRFESSGDGTFEVADVDRDVAGTEIVLHLRDADPENNLEDFVEEWTVRGTVKKYSDFIQYPIRLLTEKKEYPSDEEGKPDYDAEPTITTEWETINSQKAIWTRSQDDVEDDEYNEFYRHISRDWTEPLEVVQTKAEGMLEYYALLFVPGRAPMDLFYRDGKWGLQLYAKRVMIMEESRELLPEYLRFVRGVVDSSDLSLNVSRELLQKDRRVRAIRKRLVKKVLDALLAMKNADTDKYETFWTSFGRVIKEGVVTDADNRDRVRDLLWFESSHTVEQVEAKEAELDEDESLEPGLRYTSLDDYVSRMKDGQEAIYYITGESLDGVRNSPHLEAFEERDYEVLFLTDAYDEVMLGTLTEYADKPIKSVGKGEVDLGSDDEKKEQQEKLDAQEETHKALLEKLQEYLAADIKEVRLTQRLTSSPACLVGEVGDYSPHFTRLLEKAGAGNVPQSKRILEINPGHELFAKLSARYEANASDPLLESHARLLYGQALLAEGSPLPDPVSFSKQLTSLMVDTL